MAKLRSGTPVLIKGRVHRQTSAGDHGIESVVVWVDNPLSTTRSDKELPITVAPEQVVLPDGNGFDPSEVLDLLRVIVFADTVTLPDDLTPEQTDLLDRLAGLDPQPEAQGQPA